MNIRVSIERRNKMNLNQSRFARAQGRSQAGHAKIEPEIAEKLKSNLIEAWGVPGQITDRMCDCYSTERQASASSRCPKFHISNKCIAIALP
jgi:hypothetical protein